MNHQDLISSYIDNELSAEVEQEFLISLAASEGLRRSFRSELTLKNILHHDEAASRPPRELRGAIFSSVGLAAAPAVGGVAAGTRSFFGRILAGAKLNLLAASMMVTLSVGAGYLIHDLTEPTSKLATAIVQPQIVTEPAKSVAPAIVNPAAQDQKTVAVVENRIRTHATHHVASMKAENATTSAATQTTSLPADVNIKPQINGQK